MNRRQVTAAALVLLLATGAAAACRPEESAQPAATEAAAPTETAGGVTPGVTPPTSAYPGTVEAGGEDAGQGPAEAGGAPEGAAPTAAPTSAAEGIQLPSPAEEEVASASARITSAEPGEGLSADMLSDDEASQAAGIVLESLTSMVGAATSRDAVGAADVTALAERPNYRVIYVQRAPTKSTGDRAAEVVVYRYDTDEVALNQVDLATGQVSALPVPPGYEPPLLPQEIQEAARVARADPAARDAIAAAGLDPDSAGANGLLTGAVFDADSPCSSHRCLRLFFFDNVHREPTFSIIVDVSALQVVEVSPMSMDEGAGQ
jgi:hypothetical protein